jgi:hypothetical protein
VFVLLRRIFVFQCATLLGVLAVAQSDLFRCAAIQKEMVRCAVSFQLNWGVNGPRDVRDGRLHGRGGRRRGKEE